jgi:hypothetical protein
MNTRRDRHGNALCEVCGVAPHYHGGECQDSDILTESIRKVIARAIARRAGSDVAASDTLRALELFMSSRGLAIVDEHGNILEI